MKYGNLSMYFVKQKTSIYSQLVCFTALTENKEEVASKWTGLSLQQPSHAAYIFPSYLPRCLAFPAQQLYLLQSLQCFGSKASTSNLQQHDRTSFLHKGIHTSVTLQVLPSVHVFEFEPTKICRYKALSATMNTFILTLQ